MSNQLVLCQLTYDVPTNVGIDPCPRLRRIAAHTQLSAWVIPEHLFPHSYFHELAERGVTWDLVKFDPSEADKLIKMAARGIAKDMEKAMTDAGRSIERTTAEYHDPNLRRGKGKGVHLTVSDFEERSEAAVKRAQEVVGDLEEAAKIFNIDPATLPVQWAASRAQVLRSAAHERARRYAGAGEAAATLPNGQFVAAAVKADAMPVNALADFLQENGAEQAAEELTTSFAPAPVVHEFGDEESLAWERPAAVQVVEDEDPDRMEW